jgi:two-component system, NtrC family, sensor histidine kinase KinB
MNRSSVSASILLLLAITTTITLVLNIPPANLVSLYLWQFVVYAALTAFALYFGMLLTEGELSLAHIVGMIAFLSLPEAAQSTMIWAVFVGGLIGGLLLVTRARERLPGQLSIRTARSVIVITARVTLSLYVAGQIYSGFNGDQPLTDLDQAQGLPLLAFSLLYSLIYFAIFLLEMYSEGRSVQRIIQSNLVELFAILILPVPFAVLGAEAFNSLSLSSFSILTAGLMLVILGLHLLSKIQYRLRKQVHELRSLSAVGQAMRSNLNLDTLLETIYLQVANLLNARNFLVALYDREGRNLHFPIIVKHGEVLKSAPAPDASPNTLLGFVLETQAPLLIRRDVAEQSQQMKLMPPSEMVYSWLGVPLLAGGRTLGAMLVTSDDPQRQFNTEDLRLLNIVSASASVAIDNAQLYEQQTARVAQLGTLNAVLALLTGTLSSDTVLDIIISSASAITEGTAVAVYLFWDEAENTLALVRSAGLSERFSADPPEPMLMQRLNKPLLTSRRPVMVKNVATDKRTATLQPLMAAERKSAWIELPLVVGDTKLGVMVIYFNEPQHFNAEHVELLRTFANQAAQAISNAHQYSVTYAALRQRIEHLSTLTRIGSRLTTMLDIKSIYELVLQSALDALEIEAGIIILYDEKRTALQVIAAKGYPEGVFERPAVIYQGLTGLVLQNGQPVRVDDVRLENTYLPLISTTRSQLSVPITRGATVLGAITLETSKLKAFKEEDTQFITQLVNQAVITMDNARLFQRISENRDRLQVILNAMDEAIVLLDRSGEIALANPRVEIMGLKPEDLIGRRVDDLIQKPGLNVAQALGFESDQDLNELLKELRSTEHEVQREPVSYTAQGDNGSLYIQRHLIPVRDENGQEIGALLVFYDETEERQLARAREDLSRMIVHDLRSPLTAVTTSLKLLKEIIPVESEFRPATETTIEASQRAIRKLLARVDSLLDISKMESGRINLDTEPSELATLVDSVCIELSPLAHELDVKLNVQIAEALPLLDIDADKVERVILNLVDNALKFSPRNTSVTIKAAAPPPGEKMTRVQVIDQGPGVPNEYKEQLFERYVQISGRRGTRRGVGLGLTFCKLVVEAHGGRIWIDDNPGGGSIFNFTLPATQVDDLWLDESDERMIGE